MDGRLGSLRSFNLYVQRDVHPLKHESTFPSLLVLKYNLYPFIKADGLQEILIYLLLAPVESSTKIAIIIGLI